MSHGSNDAVETPATYSSTNLTFRMLQLSHGNYAVEGANCPQGASHAQILQLSHGAGRRGKSKIALRINATDQLLQLSHGAPTPWKPWPSPSPSPARRFKLSHARDTAVETAQCRAARVPVFVLQLSHGVSCRGILMSGAGGTCTNFN